jgi:hypothetical protein
VSSGRSGVRAQWRQGAVASGCGGFRVGWRQCRAFRVRWLQGGVTVPKQCLNSGFRVASSACPLSPYPLTSYHKFRSKSWSFSVNSVCGHSTGLPLGTVLCFGRRTGRRQSGPGAAPPVRRRRTRGGARRAGPARPRCRAGHPRKCLRRTPTHIPAAVPDTHVAHISEREVGMCSQLLLHNTRACARTHKYR